MEPIPLARGQLILTSPDDHTLLAREPDRIAAALAANPDELDRMRMTCPEVPVGLTLTCPPVPHFDAPPMTQPYIERCRRVFRDGIAAEADFYYLTGAADFRALRAAVLAMTDLTGANLVAELDVDADARLPDGVDVLAAAAVLQRIGVSTIILRAGEPADLEDALTALAPYVRVSLGVRCPAVWLLRDVRLPNVELFVPVPGERARRLADLARDYAARAASCTIERLVDDVALAPDGRDCHIIDWTTDISDEVVCDHMLGERLLELEDQEPAAFKLLLQEDDDVLILEENLYMITRPVCICAESPELLEKALRVYAGLALYDGTWEQEPRILKYFTEKYGLICM